MWQGVRERVGVGGEGGGESKFVSFGSSELSCQICPAFHSCDFEKYQILSGNPVYAGLNQFCGEKFCGEVFSVFIQHFYCILYWPVCQILC